jgi:hypothetical protein
MFLVIDTASNNVLDEFETFHEAEQRRIRVVGMNPALASYVEVVDLGAAMARYDEAIAAHKPSGRDSLRF